MVTTCRSTQLPTMKPALPRTAVYLTHALHMLLFCIITTATFWTAVRPCGAGHAARGVKRAACGVFLEGRFSGTFNLFIIY